METGKLKSGNNNAYITIDGNLPDESGNINVLPSTPTYSVLNNGEFIDLETPKESSEIFIFTDENAVNQTFENASVPTLAPFYLYNMGWLQGKSISEISYCPKNNLPLSIGLGDFKNRVEALEGSVDDIKTWKSDFVTINPNVEDFNKLTTFKLDGSDSRVVRNSTYVTEDNFMFVPESMTLGFEERSSSSSGSFGFSRDNVNGTENSTAFFCVTDPDIVNDPSNTNLTFNFKLVEKITITDSYEVPIIDKLNSTDVSLSERLTTLESKVSSSELTGKYVSFIGDSITTYSGHIPSGYPTYYPIGDVNDVSKTYWKMVIDELELNLLVNNSYSGSRVSNTGSGSVVGTGRATQLHNSTHEPDIIIINIGTNDFNNEVEFGTYAGLGTAPSITSKPTSFSEAYAVMLQQILTRYKTAQVYCCTIPAGERHGSLDFPEVNDSGIDIATFNNRIRQISTAFGCKIIELALSGVNNFNKDINMVDYSSSTGLSLHPNGSGMRLFANQIKGQLLSQSTSTGAIFENSNPDALPINDNYSVLNEGEFVDLFEYGELTTYVTNNSFVGTDVDNIAVAPFYLEHSNLYYNKLIEEFTYIPTNNKSLELGISNFPDPIIAVEAGEDLSSWDFDFITITPNAEDFENKTTFRLDGSDSRVVRNSNYIDSDSNLMFLPENTTLVIERRDETGGALGSFKYIASPNPGNPFEFYYYLSGVLDKSTSLLNFEFKLINPSPGYVVPKVKEFDERLINLENNSNTLPVNSNYSVLNKGEFVDLFEEEYNILSSTYTSSYTGSTPIDDQIYFFVNNNEVGSKIEGFIIQCLKAGTMVLGVTSYPYIDLETFPSFVLDSIRGFEEELCTITFSESDINRRLLITFDNSRVSGLNTSYWNSEGGYVDLGSKTLGFKVNDGILGRDGIDRGRYNISARYHISDTPEVVLSTDSVPISIRRYLLGYSVPEMKILQEIIYEKQDRLLSTNSILITSNPSGEGDDVSLFVDETATKGNVTFSSSVNGISASVNVPTFEIQVNPDGSKTLVIND